MVESSNYQIWLINVTGSEAKRGLEASPACVQVISDFSNDFSNTCLVRIFIGLKIVPSLPGNRFPPRPPAAPSFGSWVDHRFSAWALVLQLSRVRPPTSAYSCTFGMPPCAKLVAIYGFVFEALSANRGWSNERVTVQGRMMQKTYSDMNSQQSTLVCTCKVRSPNKTINPGSAIYM